MHSRRNHAQRSNIRTQQSFVQTDIHGDPSSFREALEMLRANVSKPRLCSSRRLASPRRLICVRVRSASNPVSRLWRACRTILSSGARCGKAQPRSARSKSSFTGSDVVASRTTLLACSQKDGGLVTQPSEREGDPSLFFEPLLRSFSLGVGKCAAHARRTITSSWVTPSNLR